MYVLDELGEESIKITHDGGVLLSQVVNRWGQVDRLIEPVGKASGHHRKDAGHSLVARVGPEPVLTDHALRDVGHGVGHQVVVAGESVVGLSYEVLQGQAVVVGPPH